MGAAVVGGTRSYFCRGLRLRWSFIVTLSVMSLLLVGSNSFVTFDFFF